MNHLSCLELYLLSFGFSKEASLLKTIKKASRIKLPMEFETWYEENEDMLKIYLKRTELLKVNLTFPYEFIFKNPYNLHPSGINHLPQILKIKFIGKSFSVNSDAQGSFDYENQTIKIYSNNCNVDELKYTIMHELIHAIDPKFNKGDKIYENFVKKWKKNNLHSRNNDSEFDAYQYEIIETLIDNLPRQEILDYISSGDILQIPHGINQSYRKLMHDVISSWSDDQIKRFRKNVYSAVISKMPE